VPGRELLSDTTYFLNDRISFNDGLFHTCEFP
jgi:hypothetical protein